MHAALRDLATCMRPGGRLCVVVPSRDSAVTEIPNFVLNMPSDMLVGTPDGGLKQIGKKADDGTQDKTKGFEVSYGLFSINGKILGARPSRAETKSRIAGIIGAGCRQPLARAGSRRRRWSSQWQACLAPLRSMRRGADFVVSACWTCLPAVPASGRASYSAASDLVCGLVALRSASRERLFSLAPSVAK